MADYDICRPPLMQGPCHRDSIRRKTLPENNLNIRQGSPTSLSNRQTGRSLAAPPPQFAGRYARLRLVFLNRRGILEQTVVTNTAGHDHVDSRIRTTADRCTGVAAPASAAQIGLRLRFVRAGLSRPHVRHGLCRSLRRLVRLEKTPRLVSIGDGLRR